MLSFFFPFITNVEQARSVPHPQMSFRWVALLPNLIKFEFPIKLQSPPSFPVPIVEEAEIPFMSASNYLITEGAQNYSVADKHSLGNSNVVSFSIYTDQYGIALSYIKAWKDLIRNKDRTFNYPSEYKYDIMIFLTVTMGVPYVGFKLKGAFPMTTSFDRLGYGRTDRLILNQEFSVDDVEIFNPTDYIKSEAMKIISRVYDIAKPEFIPGSVSID